MSEIQQSLTTASLSQMYTNPAQMTDMIMSQLMISKLGSVMQSEFVMTVPNICKLLLLLSAGEIKNGMNALLTQFITYIKQTPEMLLSLVMFLSKFMKRNNEQIENKQETSHSNLPFINITIEQNFLISLCNYIFKNRNCTFKEITNDAIIKNSKENNYESKLDNIVIDFEDYSLELIGNLVCGCDINTNEISYARCNDLTSSLSVNSYLDLLTDKQKDIVTKIYNYIEKTTKGANMIGFFSKSIPLNRYNDETFTENTIVKLLLLKYPSFDKDRTFMEVMIVGSILYSICSSACITDAKNQLKKCGKMLFDRNNNYSLSSDIYNNTTSSASNINDFYVNVNACLTNLQLDKKAIGNEFNTMCIPIDTTANKNASSCLISFIVHTKTPQKINTKHVITNFVSTINKSFTKNSTKTKIYYVKLVDDKQVTETPNPEYEDYENKKKLLEQIKPGDTNPSNVLLYEFMSKPAPPKTITNETITKKIECKFLNEMEKNFDTLFLRDKDRKQLTNSLEMFKNKGHILQKLGLQNKFNLLLYGEPGTGKSTTIQAVANYLQKDIYYIDLQKVETNEDLHMMFEYVNKNVINSGIIVMEDIDAMTDVVLKRTDKLQEYKVNDIITNQKSKLSLEYLLNILQGTLTMDNSVFIVTTNHIDHLDPAFYRDGRFDVRIELKLCDKYQIKNMYKMMIGKDLPDTVLSKIPENKYSPANIIYHVKNYIFNNEEEPVEIMEPFITA
jgi:Cdc6-like AAA superfamily ATPase